MSENLKPCPFCGDGSPVVTHGHTFRDGGTVYLSGVWCRTCETQGPNVESDTEKGGEAEAVRLWNTRALPKPKPVPHVHGTSTGHYFKAEHWRPGTEGGNG